MPVSAEQWRSATGTNNMRRPRQVSGSGKFSFRKSGPDGVFFAHILPVGKVPPTGKSDRLDFSAIINFMIFALAIYEILWSSEFPVEQGGIDNYLRCQMSIVACEMIAQLVSSFILKLILMLSGDVETNPGPEVVLTVKEHLQYVRAAVLNVAYKWKDFGLALGVNPDTLETIRGRDEDCLYQILKIWIQSGQATIDHMLSALEDPSVYHCDIAKEIRAFKGDDRYKVGLGPDENTSASTSSLSISFISTLQNEFKIADKQIDRPIEERDLFYIGGLFGAWTSYVGVPGLGLSDGEQHTIRADRDLIDNQQRMLAALKVWQRRNPLTATFRNLLGIVLELNDLRVAKIICQYISKPSSVC